MITPAFTSCENEHPAVNVTLNSDYSGIVEAINSVNTTLLDKLALIEEAIKNGTVASGEANDLIKKALETMNGTLEDKLAAIEEAIKSQTTSLESKLGLIETALKTGFTDQKTALGEIKTALESIKGSVDGQDGGNGTPPPTRGLAVREPNSMHHTTVHPHHKGAGALTFSQPARDATRPGSRVRKHPHIGALPCAHKAP